MKVLIADDDRSCLIMAQAALHALGHECALASDGSQAWEQYRRHRPDVLITDRDMPGLDGAELCRRVRADQHDDYTYIILLTTLSDPQDVLSGMLAGADDYLPKPLDPVALEGRLLAAQRVTALHAQLGESRRDLGRQARTDPLTGLNNRLGLAHAMTALHSASRRLKHTYSIALCDVDHFKAYNDLYGHPAGDRALQTVATVLREGLRGEDTAFRYGGEEFLVLMPNQDLTAAVIPLERVRASLRAAGVEHRTSEHGVVSLSIGVSSCAPDREATSEELLCEADAALYEAKRAGRDRVSPSLPIPTATPA